MVGRVHRTPQENVFAYKALNGWYYITIFTKVEPKMVKSGHKTICSSRSRRLGTALM